MSFPTNAVISKLALVEGGKMFIEYHQSSSSIEETSCTKLTLMEESSLATELHSRVGSMNCLINQSDELSIRFRPESLLQPTSECYSFSDAESWSSVRNEEGSESMCCSPNDSEMSISSIPSDKQKISKESKATRPGRLGDPRMNRAVQAKLDNPDIPLISALVRGGFVFPGLEESKGQLSLVKDIDNVTGK